MPCKYADIIINISHEAVDRVFQYKIPDSLCGHIEIGMQVEIPFGRGNSKQTGYVVHLSDQANYDVTKLKAIIGIVKESVVMETHFIQLAYWIKEHYGSTMNQALKAVLPIKDKVSGIENKSICLRLSKDDASRLLDVYEHKKYVAKVRLLKALLDSDGLNYSTAVKRFNISRTTIASLEKDEVIEIISQKTYREPVRATNLVDYQIVLNDLQKKIYNEFANDYEKGINKTYLLHGVTGSGKTEIYIEAIAKIISMKKQAIVLIPEIALTYQTVTRFQSRFGNRVTIMNSKLSKGERYDQFMRAKNGEIDIMIGPRSALFTPFENLGLIVIDEEHEGSYKSETSPKYHAREVAIKRASMVAASVILGSATPSIESYTKAKLGEYRLWSMAERVNQYAMPTVQIVDLREELKDGNRSMFSHVLREHISDCLRNNEQAMLFINRRGYAGFVSCRSCGYVAKCPHCDVSLTYHKNGSLKCHYCGYERLTPAICPECKSKHIASFGLGTQKVEEAVIREFPGARVLRMDMDTTKRKGGHEAILTAFSNQEADILVGTQMIVKGHDFSKVSLVGILAADLSLHSSDYRASERTFQLLTQAAGRAGRAGGNGQVVIQTYSPEHYSILAAKAQDYEAFYEQELAYRRILKYPPVYQMLVVFITSQKEAEAITASQAIFDAIACKRCEELVTIGPTEASLSKINNIYRRVIYLKHLEYDALVGMKDYLEGYISYSDIFKNVQVLFDFNPMNTY